MPWTRQASPQYLEGSSAWSNGKPQNSNPYDFRTQSVYYRRWLKGYLEYERLSEFDGSLTTDLAETDYV